MTRAVVPPTIENMFSQIMEVVQKSVSLFSLLRILPSTHEITLLLRELYVMQHNEITELRQECNELSTLR